MLDPADDLSDLPTLATTTPLDVHLSFEECILIGRLIAALSFGNHAATHALKAHLEAAEARRGLRKGIALAA